MLRFVDFNDPDFLLTMAKRFGVTPTLCQERTQKIKDNSAPRFIAGFSLSQFKKKDIFLQQK
jgi:hypothetical protein